MSLQSPMVSPMVANLKAGLPFPLLFMPLVDDLSLSRGVGTATFTRSTIGTFVDRNDGLVKTSAIDVARFEQNGILIEGASTNLLLRSEEFDNAAWGAFSGAVVTANTGLGADGLLTADKITYDGTANGRMSQDFTSSANDDETFSIYIRKLSGTWAADADARINMFGTGMSATATLLLGDILNAAQVGELIRYDVSGVASVGGGTVSCTIRSDEVAVLEIWGADAEPLPFASSYIKTVASTVTRTADFLTIPAANINQTVFSLSMDFTPFANGNDYSAGNILRLWGTDDSRGITNEFRTVAEGSYKFTATPGAGFYSILDTDFVKDQLTKWVFIASQNGANTDIEIYRDAVNKLSTSPVLTLDHSNTSVGIGQWPGNQVTFGHIKNFRIDDVALTAAQVGALP